MFSIFVRCKGVLNVSCSWAIHFEKAIIRQYFRFAHGQPMAPYNTTQFLLEDYEARQAEEAAADELDLHHRSNRVRTRSESYAGSENSEGWFGLYFIPLYFK